MLGTHIVMYYIFSVYKPRQLDYRIIGETTAEEINTVIKLGNLKFIWNCSKHVFQSLYFCCRAASFGAFLALLDLQELGLGAESRPAHPLQCLTEN